MVQDIQAISHFLHYSDAIFVDRQCHRLLCDSPAATRLPSAQGRVFSIANRDDFMRQPCRDSSRCGSQAWSPAFGVVAPLVQSRERLESPFAVHLQEQVLVAVRCVSLDVVEVRLGQPKGS
jgi:hypothetical protein